MVANFRFTLSKSHTTLPSPVSPSTRMILVTPVSDLQTPAYHLANDTTVLEGNCAQKTSFSGRTINVKQVGHGLLKIKLADGKFESYLITLPRLKIEGLWYGAPYVELDQTSLIQSSHGLVTKIEYRGKGWVSGKSHSFTATISSTGSTSSSSHHHHSSSSGSVLYTIDGTWTGESHFIKPSNGGKEGQLFLNAAGPTNPIEVRPVEQQGEFESRRAWKAVADGIRKGDFESASQAKAALEVRIMAPSDELACSPVLTM